MTDDSGQLGAEALAENLKHRAGKTCTCCPVCGISYINERTTKDPPWRCRAGHEFDEPDVRPVSNRPRVNPDDHLRTDGGEPARCDDHPGREAIVVTDDGAARCAACQLEAARNGKSTTERGPKRCPNPDCGPADLDVGSARIKARVRAADSGAKRYYCKECGNDFDVPVYAARQQRLATDGGVDLETVEVIYRITRAGNGSIGKFHARPDCYRIRHANVGPVEADPAHHPGWRDNRCPDCWPDLGYDTNGGGSTPSASGGMDRVTLRVPKQQIDEVEWLVDTGRFPNRSEAIRQAIRELLNEYGGSQEDLPPARADGSGEAPRFRDHRRGER